MKRSAAIVLAGFWAAGRLLWQRRGALYAGRQAVARRFHAGAVTSRDKDGKMSVISN